MSSRRGVGIVIAATVALLVVSTSGAMAAKGGNGGKPGGGNGGGSGGGPSVAVVSLGDSYISGEAGRWAGNSLDDSGSRDGTDRAYVKKGGGRYDTSLVYLDGTDTDGCHRSDVADIHSAAIPGTVSINLACSGAVTANVFRASQGGQSQNGWAPQADQLATVARRYDVALVVLSIGGNDLGFSDIIIACTEDWFTSPSWWENHCNGEQQDNVDARMAGMRAGVAKAIDEIRAVLKAAGDTGYRLILRSYPSPIPRASENRYPESGWSRWNDGGCPFWNEDADWARDSLVPQIAENLRAVAADERVEFLDEQDLLQGREVCSTATSHVTSSPDATRHEWVRWLNTGFSQGDAQESLHPNAFGQQAAGACIAAMWAANPGTYTCTNVSGAGPGTVTLASLS
jgi:hypothetical protein